MSVILAVEAESQEEMMYRTWWEVVFPLDPNIACKVTQEQTGLGLWMGVCRNLESERIVDEQLMF